MTTVTHDEQDPSAKVDDSDVVMPPALVDHPAWPGRFEHDTAPTPMPTMPSFHHAFRRLRASVAWDDRHRRLASQPFLTGLTRPEIRRWALAADEVEFDEGQVLVREGTVGYWFFLVSDGGARVTRAGRPIGTLAPGDHLGATAILGFGPQPATVVATSRMRAFVVDRRHLLALASDLPLIQQRLFPDMKLGGYVGQVRQLRTAAADDWRAIVLAMPKATRGKAMPFRALEVRPGRTVGRPDSTLANLVGGIFAPRTEGANAASAARTKLSWRARAAVAASAVVALAGFGLAYHPPMAVVTRLRPIDVATDITVRGASVRPVHGRYLLLPVRLDRPNLLGSARALVLGRDHIAINGAALSKEDRADAQHRAAESFMQSQRDAAAAVTNALGYGEGVSVTFRPRAIGGPSAGLVYALALADMMDARDLANGHTIAATGAIDGTGRVGAIGFVEDKADAATAAHADILFVPRGQVAEARHARLKVAGVNTVRDAIQALVASQT